jgi:hypothetical protein
MTAGNMYRTSRGTRPRALPRPTFGGTATIVADAVLPPLPRLAQAPRPHGQERRRESHG